VHQLLAGLAEGDAVSGHAFAIQKILRRAGYSSDLFVEHADPRLRGEVRLLEEYPKVSSSETVCLFHFAIGSAAGPLIHAAPDTLVLVYHNITPATFFLGFNNHLTGLCYHGRRQLGAYAGRTALALTPSEFNRRELEAAGFRRTGVLPLLLDPGAYRAEPSPVLRRLFDDGKTNVLFVGRLSPNKGLDQALRAFALFQRRWPKSRLLLVGDDRGVRHYPERLREIVRALRLRDVVFLGHVSPDELRACYLVARVLLSLSEHEGFCAPLLEAMFFGVPVLALDRGAVRETLGGAGVLVGEPEPALVAGLLEELSSDGPMRDAVRRTESGRVRSFEAHPPDLLASLAPVLQGAPA
jgi:glycosyltransferase involved in cell wall biosynthesis